MTRFKPNTSVACIVHCKNHFLMVKETIDKQVKLNQPAGHLEHGESLAAAATRELFEETGIHAQPVALCGIYLTPTQQVPLTFLRFSFVFELDAMCSPAPQDPQIDSAVWMTQQQIEALTGIHRGPALMRSLNDYLSGKRIPLDTLTFIPE